jgi:uncharacterized protein
VKIYLDSCSVIYVVERHPVYSALIQAQMRSTTATFCFSSLVRLECLVLPLRNNDAALLNRYEAFFNQAR